MTKYWFLAFIFVVALFFRFYRLGEVPLGLHRDEAFLGYNAFSILKTGRDMTGNFLPLHLESFLYSPAGYSYFSVPFIAIFGLSAFSVRFASAFFGSLTVLVFYFLIKELSKELPNSLKIENCKLKIPGVAALLLTISPWHINLSRTATESVIVLFFLLLGMYVFFLWVRKRSFIMLAAAFLCFGITMFLYQAPRAFLPFFIPLLMWMGLAGKDIRRLWVQISGFFLVCIIVPLIFILTSKDLSLRIRTVSIFASSQTQLVLNQQIREDGVFNVNRVLTRVFHNKLIGYSQEFFENYFNHFNYNFLFTDQGFPERYKVPLVGLLYLFDIPLLIFGLLALTRGKNKILIFFATWLLIVPIGSALTFDDVPNLQRTLLMVPCFLFFSSVGLVWLYSFLKKQKFQILFSAIFGIFIVWNVGFYLHQYYVHVDQFRPWYRQQGYAELVSKIDSFLPKYKKVIITDHESAPTVFFLFYKKYDPTIFQKNIQGKILDNYDRVSFDSYVFTQEECPLRETKEKGLIGEPGVLYVVGSVCKVPLKARLLETVYRLDNSVAFQIMDVD